MRQNEGIVLMFVVEVMIPCRPVDGKNNNMLLLNIDSM
jgi:hypothetical protein